MNPTHAHLYRYSIPFSEPVFVRGRRLLLREGIVVELRSEDGALNAFGEIAPLPGLHRENLDSARNQLIKLLASHNGNRCRLDVQGMLPSVQTGLEMAMINFRAAAAGVRPFADEPAASHLPLNTLLFGDTETVLARAWEQFTMGYRTFKLKVTAARAADAAASIRELRREFGDAIELRLDANQSMQMEEAVAFCAMLPEGSISYIEEPITEPARIGEFHHRTSIRAALDESLWQHPELFGQLPDDSLAALVIKPNCIGGIDRIRSLARSAQERGLQAVFSSAFESGISLGFYALLASLGPGQPPACGLDTFRYLSHDLLSTPFGTENASLEVESLYRQSRKPDSGTMKKISVWTL